jgi:queuine tRNA-ribosyltransferase
VSYGSDVVISLDDCTHVDAPFVEQQLSVRRTVDWARRGKREFERLMEQKHLDPPKQPRLFAVIQGGGYPELRRQCAEALLEIGFDGFGYGGWPLDSQKNLLTEIIGLTRQLIPDNYPMHALGVGHPENVLACFDLGYPLFDSAMPTRDARHGRLYTFNYNDKASQAGLSGKWMDYLYIQDECHIKDRRPLSPYCDCLTCNHYSVGYLHHLFKINDSAFYRLATIHNLRFMVQLCQRLRLRKAGPVLEENVVEDPTAR